jgi:hypothetical protein
MTRTKLPRPPPVGCLFLRLRPQLRRRGDTGYVLRTFLFFARLPSAVRVMPHRENR